MKSFIKGRWKAVGHAFRGLFYLIITEHSIISQLVVAICVTILGFIFSISRIEWMFQTLAIGLVLVAEGLNTAVEKIADFIHPHYDEKIGIIKDIAAGAVMFAALIAIVIGLFIYVPYFR